MRSDTSDAPTRSPAAPGAARRPRRRAVLLGLLLALTLAAGVAARRPAAGPPVSDTGSSVSARSGDVHLGATLDRGSVLQGGDGTLRVELVIGAEAGADLQAPARTPTDLVVVLDRSGSMRGEPLRLARAAVLELAGRLTPADRFGLVTYASGGEVAIGLQPAGPGSLRRWRRVVDGIGAGGGTHMARGLDLAHGLVTEGRAGGRAPRVILISDGHANQGDHSLLGLRGRAARAVPAEYVLSTVGVGQGFDEQVMSAISDAGTGNFHYLPDARELAGVFAAEFAAARERAARALEVRIEPADGVSVVDAAGLPLERADGAVRFFPGDLYAGQERRLWVTLRAPTHAAGELATGRVALAFRDAAGERRELQLPELPAIACVAGEDEYFASFDDAAYRRSAAEAIGALKQKVAAHLREGRRDAAQTEVDASLVELKAEQLRALGYLDAGSVQELEALRDAVAAPAAAEPAEQRRLGKELLEAGRDQRRAGSKRE